MARSTIAGIVRGFQRPRTVERFAVVAVPCCHLAVDQFGRHALDDTDAEHAADAVAEAMLDVVKSPITGPS